MDGNGDATGRELAGMPALITGAGSGIGRAIALHNEILNEGGCARDQRRSVFFLVQVYTDTQEMRQVQRIHYVNEGITGRGVSDSLAPCTVPAAGAPRATPSVWGGWRLDLP